MAAPGSLAADAKVGCFRLEWIQCYATTDGPLYDDEIYFVIGSYPGPVVTRKPGGDGYLVISAAKPWPSLSDAGTLDGNAGHLDLGWAFEAAEYLSVWVREDDDFSNDDDVGVLFAPWAPKPGQPKWPLAFPPGRDRNPEGDFTVRLQASGDYELGYSVAAGHCTWYKTVEMLPEYWEQDVATGVIYLDDEQRRDYALRVDDRGLLVDSQGEVFDTSDLVDPNCFDCALFVMDEYGRIYARKGAFDGVEFHHSSFLAGLPVAAAGQIRVKKGILREAYPCSGHYRPTLDHLLQLKFELAKRGHPAYRLQEATFFDRESAGCF